MSYFIDRILCILTGVSQLVYIYHSSFFFFCILVLNFFKEQLSVYLLLNFALTRVLLARLFIALHRFRNLGIHWLGVSSVCIMYGWLCIGKKLCALHYRGIAGFGDVFSNLKNIISHTDILYCIIRTLKFLKFIILRKSCLKHVGK